MHQILQIEFEMCIFLSFLGGVTPQTPPFFSMVKGFSSNKGIKTRKVGGIDIKIANILLKMNIVFFSKMLAKGMRQIAQIKFESCNFFFSFWEGNFPLRSFWEGTSPQIPLFLMAKDL